MHGSGLLGSYVVGERADKCRKIFSGGGNISTNIFDSLLSAISPMNSMRVLSDGCGRSDSGRRLSGDDGGSGLSERRCAGVRGTGGRREGARLIGGKRSPVWAVWYGDCFC